MNIKALRSSLLARSVAIICIVMVSAQMTLMSAITAHAADAAPATAFSHHPPEYLQPGARILVNCRISDPAKIKLARCYFRAAGDAEYVFVPMNTWPNNLFTATLPAMSNSAKALQYRFLSVNSMGQIAKTSEFTVNVKQVQGNIPYWQSAADPGTIKVNTEIAREESIASQGVTGFDDKILIQVAQSSARYLLESGAGGTGVAMATDGSAAVAAKNTGVTQIASGTGKSTNSVLDAPTKGSSTIMGIKSSTFWWIVAGVTVAAIAGTVAAVSNSSGGSGGGSGGGQSGSGSITAHW